MKLYAVQTVFQGLFLYIFGLRIDKNPHSAQIRQIIRLTAYVALASRPEHEPHHIRMQSL